MTPTELGGLRARNQKRRELKDAATPGPWMIDPPWGLPWEVGGNCRSLEKTLTVARTLGGPMMNMPQEDADQATRDAQFIAAARNDPVEADIDALIAEVKNLQDDLEEAEEREALERFVRDTE